MSATTLLINKKQKILQDRGRDPAVTLLSDPAISIGIKSNNDNTPLITVRRNAHT
jgi:hypothetical protein